MKEIFFSSKANELPLGKSGPLICISPSSDLGVTQYAFIKRRGEFEPNELDSDLLTVHSLYLNSRIFVVYKLLLILINKCGGWIVNKQRVENETAAK